VNNINIHLLALPAANAAEAAVDSDEDTSRRFLSPLKEQ